MTNQMTERQQDCDGPCEIVNDDVTIVIGCPECTREIAPEVERRDDTHVGTQFAGDMMSWLIYQDDGIETHRLSMVEECLPGPGGWVKLVTTPPHFCPCGPEGMVCRTMIYSDDFRTERVSGVKTNASA